MSGLYHQFLAHLRGTGVAKSSHFQVTIPSIPSFLLNQQFPNFGRTLALRCEGTDLPGRQLATQENRVYGPPYKTPYQALYQESTLTFLETEDFFVRRFFETWMDVVYGVYDNQLSYPNMYRTDMIISQYAMTSSGGDTLDVTAQWNLIDAFPTGVNQMPVAWTEDGFHRVSVSFAYQYYTLDRPDIPRKTIADIAPTAPVNKGSVSGGL